MPSTLHADDPQAFHDAVAALVDFNSGPSKLLSPNFAVAIAVLLHRDIHGAGGDHLIGLPGTPPLPTGDLQAAVCDRTWSKADDFLPPNAEGPIYKPFTDSFKPPSPATNNWRNSFDLQGGLGCDAPYNFDYLRSESYLSQPRFDCSFRDPITGHCDSPAGNADMNRTCFNPNKRSRPPGLETNARQRPKILTRGKDPTGQNAYWYIEPTVDVLTELLAAPQYRVPIYPFIMALYGGSPFWRTRGEEITEGRLAEDLALGNQRFYAIFDPDPQSNLNARMLRYATGRRPSQSALHPTTASERPHTTTLSTPITFEPRSPDDLVIQAGRESDPERRAALLERATRGHRRTLNVLASYLKNGGYTVDEQLDGYDLCGRDSAGGLHLFEVKTWTAANLARQVRSGWSQLFEYRYRNSAIFAQNEPGLYLVLDREPPSEYWAWTWLANELDVLPCWIADEQLTTFPALIGRLPPL